MTPEENARRLGEALWTANESLGRVRALHFEQFDCCATCCLEWPCETAQALDSP